MLVIFKTMEWLYRRVLPFAWRYPVARGLARLSFTVDRRRRSVVIGNLAPLVGALRARELAPRLLENFAMTSVDFFCPSGDIRTTIESIDHWSYLTEAYSRTKRVMLVTAHLGHWELGMPYLVAQGLPVSGIYAPYRENNVVQWIHSHRDPKIEWAVAGAGAAAACIRAIDKGRVLGLVGDLTFGEEGRRVLIHGHACHLPLGPWAIAVRAQATVIPAFIMRVRPGVYHGTFHAPLEPGSGSFRQRMEFMQDQYRAHLESYLLKYPEQWGVLQPFWDPA